jgi:hypothetical protein
MKNVYDEKQQTYRVNYACQTMLSYAKRTSHYGEHYPTLSRKFCSCFEMGDGDEVVAKCYARALKNQKIMDVFHKFLLLDRAKRCYDEQFSSNASQQG